jgi:hypothetical protein
MSIMSQFGQSVEVVEEIPKKLKKGQGLLLLGDDAWMNQLSHLPKIMFMLNQLLLRKISRFQMG